MDEPQQQSTEPSPQESFLGLRRQVPTPMDPLSIRSRQAICCDLRIAQLVELLPMYCKVMGSIPGTANSVYE